MSVLRVNVISESAFSVQGHGVHTAFVETAESLRRQQGVEVQQNGSKKADILHIHTVGPYCLARLFFWPGKKVVSAHVTPDSFIGSLIGARYWYRLASWYLRWFYNRADAVLAVSAEVEGELKKMGVKKPIYLAPNTIDTRKYRFSQTERQEARKKLGLKPGETMVVGCGQVQPRKGIDSLLKVAEELSKVRFIWVGGVPFKRIAAEHHHMERIMKDHPPNLSFTGVIEHSEVLRYYAAADIFFLPSHQETFGIVMVEAAAAGLPLLLRDLEQYRVTFASGYIASTEESFAAEIRKLIADPDYHRLWVKRSAAIARKYDSGAGGRYLAGIYRKLLEPAEAAKR